MWGVCINILKAKLRIFFCSQQVGSGGGKNEIDLEMHKMDDAFCK